MLTSKQHELLVFIDAYLKEKGIAPSYEEMKVAVNLTSKSGIHRLIAGLEERGFVYRLPNRARALEVLKLPLDRQAKGFTPRLVDDEFASEQAEPGPSEETAALPFYGKIAAGTPIEALSDNSRVFEVPPALLGNGTHYALEIEGDSMIDAGILDGDVVLIRRSDQAENGDIVVALVEEKEATLKRFRKRGESIALEPANSAHETRIFGPDQIRVQGRLVGLVRRY